MEPATLTPKPPPEAWEPLLRLARLARRPLERFLHVQAASGVLLLVTAAIALVCANSPWAEAYAHFWHTPVGLHVGSYAVEQSLEWVVNDGLMAIFFFVVGMEIRREIHHGELSEWRRASLPLAAALGGMIAPAVLYLALAGEPATRTGWGVPMATDIAFAVGILALLGKRVPPALRVLLLALAVIDDLGAIVVIAVFYSSGVALAGFAVAAAGFGAILVMQRAGVRTKLLYVAPAVIAWAGIAMSGIHPTIAGVLVGLMTPVRAWLGAEGFLVGVQSELDQLARVGPTVGPNEESASKLVSALHHIDDARREAVSPAESLIATLHPWVAFGVMPVFALANAGVPLPGGLPDGASLAVSIAVVAGLVLGKPLGILLAVVAVLRTNLASLPAGLTMRHMLVLGTVAGVGFTMSLFIAQLAFGSGPMLAAAKLGVLVASALSALVALLLGRFLLVSAPGQHAAPTADAAEDSTDV